MLPSRKTFEPLSLQSSTTRTIVPSPSRTAHGPPLLLFSFHRKISWDSKHKHTMSRAWKICKGFSTRDAAGQDRSRKQVYWSAFWGHSDLRRCLPSYVPLQEWRFSSSWGKNPGATSSSRNKAEAAEEEEAEDWYNRWEKQKMRQYEAFMRRVEEDTYTVLFGQSYLNLRRGKIEPKAAATAAPSDSAERNSSSKEGRDRDNLPSESRSSSEKISEEKLQEYEIDPITNRKVFKASIFTVSALEQDRPQAENSERRSEPLIKHSNPISPTQSRRGFSVFEDTQVSSNADPPITGTPPLKPHSSDGWLAQEGFGGIQKPKSEAQTILPSHDAKSKTPIAKIESALDRHLSRKNQSEKKIGDISPLQYNLEENKTEDVDLLRPSDVRASSGLRGHLPKESGIDKQVRRKRLEERFESSSPDHAVQSDADATNERLVQKGENHLVQKDTAPGIRLSSSAKGIPQDSNLKDKEASKGTYAARANGLSDTTASKPIPIGETSNTTLPSRYESGFEKWSGVAPKVQADIKDKASKLKSQIVPFKARLDAMKAEYDFLRLQWLQENRKEKEKAAKKEEERKAQRITKMANQIHEEEIKTQKVAMEAIETRTSDRPINTAKTASTRVAGNDNVEEPAPRRLQSFLQGEGDMASNVHEFAGRDRWYKRKAPHAMDAKDAEMDSKLQRLARDRTLVREIREIYEDTYGTIDTNHRQAGVESSITTGSPDHPMTISSRKVAPHAQLPSSAADIPVSSKDLNKSDTSHSLVQKLFSQLRDVHGIIQDHHSLIQDHHSLIQDHPSQTKQILDSIGQEHIRSSVTFANRVTQIVETSLHLAATVPIGVMVRLPTSANTVLKSGNLLVNRPLSAAEPTNLKSQEATKLKTYCILAYDSDTESLTSTETSKLAHFWKEELLLHSDALLRLSNPGKFLPYAISLAEKGYKPVYATSNILAFKKEIDLRESVGLNTAGATNLGPIRDAFNPVISQGGSRSFDSTAEGNMQAHEQAQLRGIKVEQQRVKEVGKPVVEKVEREDQKEEKFSQTAMDGIVDEKQPLEEDQTQQSASSSSSSSRTSHPSGDLVHRQERVFSGRRQGPSIDIGVKSKRSKRAAYRRRKTTKSMLLAGAFTAACCYCVGVVSEMMHD